jgi:excisionase family DNA binding protein
LENCDFGGIVRHSSGKPMSDPLRRETVSLMKACELVGCSRRTIYNWIAANKVEYIRTAGGSIRIFVDTLWREPGGEKVSLR